MCVGMVGADDDECRAQVKHVCVLMTNLVYGCIIMASLVINVPMIAFISSYLCFSSYLCSHVLAALPQYRSG